MQQNAGDRRHEPPQSAVLHARLYTATFHLYDRYGRGGVGLVSAKLRGGRKRFFHGHAEPVPSPWVISRLFACLHIITKLTFSHGLRSNLP